MRAAQESLRIPHARLQSAAVSPRVEEQTYNVIGGLVKEYLLLVNENKPEQVLQQARQSIKQLARGMREDDLAGKKSTTEDNNDEQKDWYIDKETGKSVMTREYLLKQGSCCGSGCRHCPYLKEENAS